MKTDDLPIGMMGQPDAVVARFRKMVKSGESPRMAEIMACRQAPGVDTDTAHYAGLPSLAKSYGVEYANSARRKAQAAGISVSETSIYNHTLADHRGPADPGAWLLAGDGRAKAKRTIQEKGGGCEDLGIKPNGLAGEKYQKRKAAMNKRRERAIDIAVSRKRK